MKNKYNKKTRQYSSVFWVCIRTGGIGLPPSSAELCFCSLKDFQTLQ